MGCLKVGDCGMGVQSFVSWSVILSRMEQIWITSHQEEPWAAELGALLVNSGLSSCFCWAELTAIVLRFQQGCGAGWQDKVRSLALAVMRNCYHLHGLNNRQWAECSSQHWEPMESCRYLQDQEESDIQNLPEEGGPRPIRMVMIWV